MRVSRNCAHWICLCVRSWYASVLLLSEIMSYDCILIDLSTKCWTVLYTCSRRKPNPCINQSATCLKTLSFHHRISWIVQKFITNHNFEFHIIDDVVYLIKTTVAVSYQEVDSVFIWWEVDNLLLNLYKLVQRHHDVRWYMLGIAHNKRRWHTNWISCLAGRPVKVDVCSFQVFSCAY